MRPKVLKISAEIIEASAALHDGPDQTHITVTQVYNFAWQHLKTAILMRDHAIRVESANADAPFGPFFEEIRAYVSACIMTSAACLEALINELFLAPHTALRATISDFEVEFWGKGRIEKQPPLEKYKKAFVLLGAPPLETTSNAYLDAAALFDLRNVLVHYKSTWDSARGPKKTLPQQLYGKFATSPFLTGSADFVTMECMSAACATWAVATTFSFIRQVELLTNLDPSKMNSFWLLEKDVG